MENNLQIFNNTEFGKVRIVDFNNQTYFVARDVALALGYTNPMKAIRDHCKGVNETFIPTDGGKQRAKIIPESDVYRLITHSKLPLAEKFERWIFEEILPTIRKTGSYSTPKQQPLPACIEDLIIQQATLLKELRIKVESQEQRIKEITHKPFSQLMKYMSCESWLHAKHIPFKRDLLWGFSRRCALYSRENNIEIHAVGKSGYAINAYREDVLERCFGNKALPVSISAPAPKKKKVELTDYLKGWFATVPTPERLVMLENFAVWGSKVPEKFRTAVLHTLTASIGKTIFEYEETKKIRRIG